MVSCTLTASSNTWLTANAEQSSIDSTKRGFVPNLWNAEADAGPDFQWRPYFAVMEANDTTPLNRSCTYNGSCSSQLVDLTRFGKPRKDLQHILDNHYAAAAANLTLYGGSASRSVNVIGNGTTRGYCQSYTTAFRADWNSTWSRLGLVIEEACDYDPTHGYGPPGMQIGFATGTRNLYYYPNYTFGLNTYILNIPI